MKGDWRREEFTCFVALGESTTAGGWSTSPDRCWVSLLGALINDFQATQMKVVNAGIGANVISTHSPSYEQSSKPAADERLDRHVIAHEPELLIISYGLNDARGGTPLSQFCGNLIRLVQRVREKINPIILLPGPYFMTDFTAGGQDWSKADLHQFHRYNEAIAKMGSTNACLYVDLLAASGQAPWTVHYDGVHQNDLGHRIVANRMFEVLVQSCSCLSLRTKEAEWQSPRWRDESTLKSDFGY